MKADEVVDLLEMTTYSAIKIDESPIIVLGCGHFFTIETLDGMVALKEVYKVSEETGHFVGLIENAELAAAVPQCPHCKAPIRQYVTQRYNRLINRAVIDEMSKRFIVNAQQGLQDLEDKVKVLEASFESTRQSLVPALNLPMDNTAVADRMLERAMKELDNKIGRRYGDARNLEKDIITFRRRMGIQHQPASKLHQATVYGAAQQTTLDSALAKLSLVPSVAATKRDRDQRIRASGLLLQIKAQCLILEDQFEVARAVNSTLPSDAPELNFRGGSPIDVAPQALQNCMQLVNECTKDSLPKLAVEASLYYARLAGLVASSGLEVRTKTTMYRDNAKELLEKATKLCEQPFKGADVLLQAVEHSAKLLGKVWYEKVTDAEKEAIKKAMVSGRGGIATHSGHWYECERGHPVSFRQFGVTRR